jgi:alpha-amylase
VGSAELTDWWDNGGSALAFGRGDKGFVALNNADDALTETFTTSLPAGTYCNVAAASPDDCDGNTVTVGDDGAVQATVPARGALALHTGAQAG